MIRGSMGDRFTAYATSAPTIEQAHDGTRFKTLQHRHPGRTARQIGARLLPACLAGLRPLDGRPGQVMDKSKISAPCVVGATGIEPVTPAV